MHWVSPQNDVRLIYKKIEEGADVNFVFGGAYGCPEGYTPLMSAAHRGRLDACKALLRAVSGPPSPTPSRPVLRYIIGRLMMHTQVGNLCAGVY
jgi:hypothetical protein